MRRGGIVAFLLSLLMVGAAFARLDIIECISWGYSNDGRIINADKLLPDDGYIINPNSYTYGTPEVIAAVKEAVARVKSLYPKSADLVIGDISKPKGGVYSPHDSHQSGRDVDIGYYFRDNYQPTGLVDAYPWSIDLAKTWTLIESMIKDDKVQYIFMDYSLQRVLYFYAAKKGVPQEKLSEIFQYPRGNIAKAGIIRYSRGHRDHMHVRFKSPRAVLAAEKYTTDELWEMYYTQPKGGKVAFYNGRIIPVARLSWYQVASGDTYDSIAEKYGVSVRELQAWNRDKKALKPGVKLAIYQPVSDPSQIEASFVKKDGVTISGKAELAIAKPLEDVSPYAPSFFDSHIFLQPRLRMPLTY